MTKYIYIQEVENRLEVYPMRIIGKMIEIYQIGTDNFALFRTDNMRVECSDVEELVQDDVMLVFDRDTLRQDFDFRKCENIDIKTFVTKITQGLQWRGTEKCLSIAKMISYIGDYKYVEYDVNEMTTEERIIKLTEMGYILTIEDCQYGVIVHYWKSGMDETMIENDTLHEAILVIYESACEYN